MLVVGQQPFVFLGADEAAVALKSRIGADGVLQFAFGNLQVELFRFTAG